MEQVEQEPSLKEIALARLHRSVESWFAYFHSRSSPDKPPYKTQYWTQDIKQFQEGQITCDCPGWTYRKQCRHQGELRKLLEDAGIIEAL